MTDNNRITCLGCHASDCPSYDCHADAEAQIEYESMRWADGTPVGDDPEIEQSEDSYEICARISYTLAVGLVTPEMAAEAVEWVML